MGKILDTIYLLFKGDTSDLIKKKKEAEQVAADVSKNIKDTKTSTDAVSGAVDQVNKNLKTTEGITTDISNSIIGWEDHLTGAAVSTAPVPIVEKARKEVEQVNKNLGVTKKGANEVEAALKKVVGQFTSAALGAFTVASAVGAYKNLVSNTLDTAQFSRNLDVDIKAIDAWGQALKEVNGNVDDVKSALSSLSAATNQSGKPLLDLFNNLAKSFQGINNPQVATAIASVLRNTYGINDKVLAAFKLPNTVANEQKIEAGGGASATTQANFLAFNTALSELTKNFHDLFIEISTNISPLLTSLIKLISGANWVRGYKRGAPGSLSPEVDPLQDAANFIGRSLTKRLEKTGGFYDTIANKVSSFPHYDTGIGLGSNALAALNNRDIAVNIGDISVNAPGATDADGISKHIGTAMEREIDFLRSYFNDGRVV